MKKKMLFVLCNFLLGASLWAQSGAGGATGFASLKLGVGARASAMGDAYSAISNDATATYWNPAGLSAIDQMEVSFTHTEWIEDISHEYLSTVIPAFKGAIGLSFYTTNVGGIERRNRPSDVPLATIEANNISAGLSYGRFINDKLSAGISAKYIYEKIFIESATGYAVDFGLLYQPFQRPLKLAAVAQNIGSLKKLKEEKTELPQTFKFGGAYTVVLPDLDGALILAVDAVKIRESDVHFSLGMEFSYKNSFLFRAGHRSGESARSFSAGIGFKLDRYRLDYGFIPFESDFGNTHKFSIGLNL